MIKELVDIMANMGYGVLIAILLVSLLMFCISLMNSQKKYNVFSYIIGLVLVVFLAYQMSGFIGGYEIYKKVLLIKRLGNTVSPTIGEVISSFTGEDVGWFLFRRIIWSVLFLIAGGFGIYISMDKKKTRAYGTPSGVQTGRRYISATNRRRR